MAIRQVPDPVLRSVCAEVTGFGDAALKALAVNMLETMYAAPGRGLAAPQVGVLARMFVMDTEWKTGVPAPMVAINPVVVSVSPETVVMQEGCLSIPDRICAVRRPVSLILRWHGTDGRSQVRAFDGFAARCIQHEMDHLDGILCTDHPGPDEVVPA